MRKKGMKIISPDETVRAFVARPRVELGTLGL
jgi:hypothetical protein